jgi:hypothetical protein
MKTASQEMRRLANRLIAYEKNGNNRTPEAVFEKLCSKLATLMGTGGFRALLLRALALATREASCLSALHVRANGSLEGLDELHARIKPEQLLEAAVVLLANLLGLLVAFIGENLTLRLVREIWPKAPLSVSNRVGGKDE